MKERSDEMRDARTARERSVGELLRERVVAEVCLNDQPGHQRWNDLPPSALANALDAADASNEALVRSIGGRGSTSYNGKFIPNEARAMEQVNAYDAARRDLLRALEGGE